MNLFRTKALTETFVIPQFNYYPLVWMFHSRKPNHRINSIHEGALRVTYQDCKSTLLQLLQKDDSLTIHQWSLQVLAIETFIEKNYLSPEIENKVLELKKPSCSLGSKGNYFVRGNVITTHYSIQSIKYLSPKI